MTRTIRHQWRLLLASSCVEFSFPSSNLSFLFAFPLLFNQEDAAVFCVAAINTVIRAILTTVDGRA